MPIRVLDELPSVGLLRGENIFVMKQSHVNIEINYEHDAVIKILILNLMPKKIETENQFLRLLSNFPLQIDIQLLCINHRNSKHTPIEHIQTFYCSFMDICDAQFDGLIVTGAPLGLVDFCDIVFWSEIKTIFLWALEHVTTSLFICWAAQAALYVLYDLPKVTRKEKLMGVYLHKTLNVHALLTRGFDGYFYVPHSRYSDFSAEVIRRFTDLEVLVESDIAGAYLFTSHDKRLVFITGHPEYDLLTLAQEYYRDLKNGLRVVVPENYFPENNPNLLPLMNWRSHGYLLFSNWLNYYVYQKVPYDIRDGVK
ncbi:homoserine O-succinyltransferase [Blochmannia endosymbiont of Polyrhachis (Hedomyrma) turneri]|uniref:homoserine O-succinyltransferase n=1 Tax=Blochmannia endosymbiont of Polyrhachis (Hedomyrma) turneri TaxID=1505596 RepID=UPI00061A75AB|nr:homoserine O-succinyltransferase [Blochmannia endosymbiont of Polyrhachis (Hedomyrma) turneri]AKC60185.1 homoserine O-succinyltransferase [Blochmannia endosymbiont of Polyrhachis (Hedomyrma) turneri]